VTSPFGPSFFTSTHLGVFQWTSPERFRFKRITAPAMQTALGSETAIGDNLPRWLPGPGSNRRPRRPPRGSLA
jgi:hypothetical protein